MDVCALPKTPAAHTPPHCDTARAIFALERVVAVRPDDQPARAELARAYLAAGESDNARAEFGRVRRADVPEEAAAAIDRVLGALDQIAIAANQNGLLDEVGIASNGDIFERTQTSPGGAWGAFVQQPGGL